MWVKRAARRWNISAGRDLCSYYFEGANGPVSDLQESQAFALAGPLAANLLPKICQNIYLQLSLSNKDCTGGLLALGSNCRIM